MLDFIIVVFCLIINAFFSAYEMAFVTISDEEIGELEDQDKLKIQLLIFKRHPERTLSVIQIGITLVGAIAAAVGGTGAVESLEPILVQKYGISNSLAEAIAVTVVIAPLTYFSVVFGELVPKTLALRSPFKILRFGTRFLSIIDRFLSPVVSFLSFSTKTLLKTIKMNSEEDQEALSEIIEIGHLPHYHQKFVLNLVELKGKKVLKSMIPWNKVFYLNFSESEDEIRLKKQLTSHSRLPVMDGPDVVGMLLVKELPESKDQHLIPWSGLIRPIMTVRSDDILLEAFLKMQKAQMPIALVEDDKQNIIGLISLEDILEGVVGDIKDKNDNRSVNRLLANRSKIQV